jgi:hypothetical protein
MTAVLDWIVARDWIIATIAGVSVVTFVGTLVAIPIVVARMRPDYFVRLNLPPESFRGRYPVLRLVGRMFKNLFGAILVLMGAVMLVLPGQGILTLLIGVSLVDFPGKRKAQIRLARQRHVKKSIAWMRKRAGKPPLRYPDEEAESDPPSTSS